MRWQSREPCEGDGVFVGYLSVVFSSRLRWPRAQPAEAVWRVILFGVAARAVAHWSRAHARCLLAVGFGLFAQSRVGRQHET